MLAFGFNRQLVGFELSLEHARKVLVVSTGNLEAGLCVERNPTTLNFELFVGGKSFKEVHVILRKGCTASGCRQIVAEKRPNKKAGTANCPGQATLQ
jgi:hypothetical protein